MVAVGLLAAYLVVPAAPTAPRTLDAAPLPEDDLARLVAAATDRVVAFGCGLSSNSGTAVVLAGGQAVTNRHVVDDALLVNVVPEAGRVVVATGLVSAAGDVALLPSAPGRPGLNLALADPRPADPLVVAGYPEDGHDVHVATTRLVDYVDGAPLGEPGPVMRLAYRARHGMSGGPVVDRAGNVAGLLFGVERTSGYSLAIPASRLRDLLAAGPFAAPAPCRSGPVP